MNCILLVTSLFFTAIGNFCHSSDTTELVEKDTLAAAVITSGMIKQNPNGFSISFSGNKKFANMNTMEAMMIIPGVANKEDGLYVKGKEIKYIYIDNQRVPLSELELLSSDMIHSVNIVMTNSVKQSISDMGASIYIRLKPLETSAYVLNLQDQLSFRDDGFSRNLTSIPIQARIGNLSIYNMLKYSFFNELHKYDKTEVFGGNESYYSNQESRIRHHTVSESVNLAYRISPSHTLSAIFAANYIKSNPYNTESSNRSFSDYKYWGYIDNIHLQGVLSYRYNIVPQKSWINAIVDYIYSKINKEYDYNYSNIEEFNQYYESNKSDNSSVKAEVEYRNGFNDRQELNVGFQLYHLNTSKRASFSVNNIIDYFELSGFQGAAYAFYNAEFSNFMITAGLRLQYDAVHQLLDDEQEYKNKYLRLCPNVGVKYLFGNNKDSSIEANVSRDGGEIPFSMLSPVPKHNDAYSYSVGNIYLKPWRGYDADVSLSIKDELFLSYAFSYGNDLINTLTFVDYERGNVVYTKPVNDGQMTRNYLNLNYNKQITKWFLFNLDIGGYIAKYSYSNMKFTDRMFSIYPVLSFNLPRSIRILLNARYTSPYKQVEYWHNGNYGIDAKVICPLLKGKLRLYVECRNIVSNLNQLKTWNSDYSYVAHNKHTVNGRIYRVSLVYAFKSKRNIKNYQRSRSLQDFNSEYD